MKKKIIFLEDLSISTHLQINIILKDEIQIMIQIYIFSKLFNLMIQLKQGYSHILLNRIILIKRLNNGRRLD